MSHPGLIVTAAQMRAIESAAFTGGHVTAQTLIQRAGQAVVDAIFDRWPALSGTASAGATVLCGPGSNGGDGFAIARLLMGHGWQVRVGFHGRAECLPDEARANHDLWCAMGQTGPLPPADQLKGDLVIDALFGIGLSQPLDSMVAALFDAIAVMQAAAAAPPFVAVDILSGIGADTGRGMTRTGCRLPAADLTVTFHAAKPGHLLADGLARAGDLRVADLGLTTPPDLAGPDMRRILRPTGLGQRHGNKFDHGSAVVLAGGPGHGGAARLSARAALRVGAGLVTICPPGAVMPEHAGPPDALMRRPLDTADDLRALLRDDRIRVVCLGPGLGVARALSLLPTLLDWGGKLVLDADAITALATRGAPLDGLHEGCVLTPHLGEFGRLFPNLADTLKSPADDKTVLSKPDMALQAAKACGAVIVLKGADTVVATPRGMVGIHADPGLGWLATAGAGDVLAGLITGLLSQGQDSYDAAAHAVWMHGQAACQLGPGLIADDLPDAIPAVLRQMGA